MYKSGQLIIGGVIVFAGLMFLLGAIFHVSPGALCLPAALILLGIYILVRPRLVGPNVAWGVTLFGPVRRDGVWLVADQEQWLFVGDVRLDFTQAQIPTGETRIRIFAFVADVRLRAPEGIGLSVLSMAFVSNIRARDYRRESFVAPTRFATEGYDSAERRIHVELVCFVSDVRVEQE